MYSYFVAVKWNEHQIFLNLDSRMSLNLSVKDLVMAVKIFSFYFLNTLNVYNAI